MSGYIDQIDPALSEANAAGPLHSLVYDGLVGHDKAGGAAGNTLVPDLAISLPRPTDHGRRYTFRLREGITFSNGRRLRQLPSAPRWNGSSRRARRSATPSRHRRRAGVSEEPERCNLSKGVVTNDETGIVSIGCLPLTRLSRQADVRPSSDRHACHQQDPIPGTSPYVIAEYDPNRRVRLVRNRHFEVWSKAVQPAGNPASRPSLFERGIDRVEQPGGPQIVEPGRSRRLFSPKWAGSPEWWRK